MPLTNDDAKALLESIKVNCRCPWTINNPLEGYRAGIADVFNFLAPRVTLDKKEEVPLNKVHSQIPEEETNRV